ncbi:bacteriocin [Escherichia coli]|uniref:bacteriocin n=2 Tax=Escherichia coli TaxID=562 RepID=UPI00201A6DE4|nr:bacteriocin [Escherichia coli]
MGYGLLDIANQSRREALQGISDADRRREEIEAANKQMAAQQKAQNKQNIGTGIGTGAAIGASVGGPCNQVNHLIPTRVLVKGGEITCKILK